MRTGKKDPVEEILRVVFSAFFALFKNTFRGMRRLNKVPAWIGLVVLICAAIMAFAVREEILGLESLFGNTLPVPVRYGLYWLCLLLPLVYLCILGSAADNKARQHSKIFEDIGFKGKDGETPYLLEQKMDGHKKNYMFRSNIPLGEWKKAKERLETALDCSIRQMLPGKNKKTVRLITVPSDFQIPNMLRWNDKIITPDDAVLHIGQSDLDTVGFDLNRTPHVLAAGETGSGKSVILRAMLWQMINKGCRLYMIDFKGGVEFGKPYERFGEVITDRKRALKVLEQLVKENQARLELFRELEVKNLREYNEKTGENLCRVGVFIDEIAEMLDKKGVAKADREIYEKLEGELSTLARLSRATGINLFLGVQRPDANVLTGQIKNNVPVRISGRFADKPASEIVLGNTAACDLPDVKGRFLYKVGNETVEFQSYYFDDEKDLRDVDIVPGDMLTDFGGGCSARITEETPKPGTSTVTVSVKTEGPVHLNCDFD